MPNASAQWPGAIDATALYDVLWIDRATDGVVCLGAEVEAGAKLAHIAFRARRGAPSAPQPTSSGS